VSTHIEWSFPQPRRGVAGAVDRFFGPGTTRGEWWVQAMFVTLATVLLPLRALWAGVEWTPLQYAVAAWFAFDLTGGIVTNATSAAKRWYHREGQGFRQHFSLITPHVVYLLAVAWLFRGGDWLYLGVGGLGLLAASALVLRLPLYLQRPVAVGLLAAAIVVNESVPPTRGLEWFLPLLFFKLLVSHALREEPYRP
jgi:hypothetical protein